MWAGIVAPVVEVGGRYGEDCRFAEIIESRPDIDELVSVAEIVDAYPALSETAVPGA